MDQRWEKIVTDPAEQRVLEALADPAWDFRTIEGVSKATKLPEAQVERIITKYKEQNLVRRSPVPDKTGRPLFTLTSKGTNVGEILNIIRSAVTKTTSG